MLKQYKDLLNIVANKFKLDFEHEYYNKIIYKNVNNYIAKTEEGKLKQKGLFVIKPQIGNSVDELVIAKALEAFYINGIKPSEFISNPEKYNLHIYDYCKSNKIGKDFKVFHNGEVQQQLNRYYFSRNAPYLFKQKKSSIYTENDREFLTKQIFNSEIISGAGYSPNYKPLTEKDVKLQVDRLIYGNNTMQHVNVGQGVKIFNNYESKNWEDYEINYAYYISATQKIIDEINNNNQLKLF